MQEVPAVKMMMRTIVIILLLLPYWVIRSFAFSWVPMSESEFNFYYQPLDLCVLRTNDYSNCIRTHVRDLNLDCSVFHNCHFRNLMDVLNFRPEKYGTAQGSKQRIITDVMRLLNQTDSALVFFGDSISRNIINSLKCAHKAEQPISSVSLDKLVAVGSKTFEFPFSVNERNYTFNFKYIAGTIFHERVLSEIERELEHYWRLNMSVVLVANLGLHLKVSATHMNGVGELLKWAQSERFGDMQGRSNVFIYRETSAQHCDGDHGLYNYTAQTCNAQTRVGCKPHLYRDGVLQDGISFYAQNERLQLALANERFQKGQTKSKVHFVEFYGLSSFFHSVHVASANWTRFWQSRNPSIDCTHWCGFIPMLYSPVWRQIYSILLLNK